MSENEKNRWGKVAPLIDEKYVTETVTYLHKKEEKNAGKEAQLIPYEPKNQSRIRIFAAIAAAVAVVCVGVIVGVIIKNNNLLHDTSYIPTDSDSIPGDYQYDTKSILAFKPLGDADLIADTGNKEYKSIYDLLNDTDYRNITVLDTFKVKKSNENAKFDDTSFTAFTNDIFTESHTTADFLQCQLSKSSGQYRYTLTDTDIGNDFITLDAFPSGNIEISYSLRYVDNEEGVLAQHGNPVHKNDISFLLPSAEFYNLYRQNIVNENGYTEIDKTQLDKIKNQLTDFLNKNSKYFGSYNNTVWTDYRLSGRLISSGRLTDCEKTPVTDTEKLLSACGLFGGKTTLSFDTERIRISHSEGNYEKTGTVDIIPYDTAKKKLQSNTDIIIFDFDDGCRQKGAGWYINEPEYNEYLLQLEYSVITDTSLIYLEADTGDILPAYIEIRKITGADGYWYYGAVIPASESFTFPKTGSEENDDQFLKAPAGE